MDNANGVPTHILCTCKLSKHGTNHFFDPKLYRSIFGVVKYVTLTRPDISFSVNKAYLFMVFPIGTHWSTIQRLLRYLSGTMNNGLLLSPLSQLKKFPFRAYNGSDWTSDADDRRLTSGSCIFFGSKSNFLELQRDVSIGAFQHRSRI